MDWSHLTSFKPATGNYFLHQKRNYIHDIGHLLQELSKFNLGSDHLFLANLTKTIFRGYLENYINIECK